jgi:hypothetical protein
MSERPDYVPPWMNWPMNRTVWGVPPVFVILWFLVLELIAIWLFVSGVIAGSVGFILSGIPSSVFLASQGVIYAPRAWRAMRRGRTDSN